MQRDHPILNALMWAAIGALAAVLAILAYSALSPSSQKTDAELDREATTSHR